MDWSPASFAIGPPTGMRLIDVWLSGEDCAVPTVVATPPCVAEEYTPEVETRQHDLPCADAISPHNAIQEVDRSGARWYNATRAAAIFGLEKHTLLGAIRRGEVPSRRIGRQHLIPAAFVDGDDLVAHRG